MKTTLSSRGYKAMNTLLRSDFDIFFEAIQNLYDKELNPNGAFPLSVAENKLMWLEMRTKISSITQNEVIPDWVSQYTSCLGGPSFREVLASFLSKYLTKCRVEPFRLGVSSGATAVIEMTTFLLGEEGDVAVFPAPCYPVYRQDIGNKSMIERYDLVTHHELDEINDAPNLSIEDLEKTLKNLQAQNKRFRMLIITNPDNPTGGLYSLKQLKVMANWCSKHGIHMIVNEIYGLSIIDTSHPEIQGDYQSKRDFESFALIMEQKKSDFLHLWYSLSKDFGISGFRVGMLYSFNEDLIKAYDNFSAPHLVSNYTQWVLERVLVDDEFVGNYIIENQKRLTESYVLVVKTLKKLNIPYVPSRGSLFIWIDMSKYLVEDTKEDENEFWLKIYKQTGVLLTPGDGFGHSKFGQFRMVYPSVSKKDLIVALRRLEIFLDNSNGVWT